MPSGRVRSRTGIPLLPLMVIVDEISSGDAGAGFVEDPSQRRESGQRRTRWPWGSLIRFRLSSDCCATNKVAPSDHVPFFVPKTLHGVQRRCRWAFVQRVTRISTNVAADCATDRDQQDRVKRQRPCPGGQGLEPFAATSSGAEAE